MAEERKPLEFFMARKAINGGWVIAHQHDERMRGDEYSYSSDRDMLAALPGLIGAVVTPAERAGDQQRAVRDMQLSRQRSDAALNEPSEPMGITVASDDPR